MRRATASASEESSAETTIAARRDETRRDEGDVTRGELLLKVAWLIPPAMVLGLVFWFVSHVHIHMK